MKIGIIVAMDKEMNLLLPHLEDIEKKEVNGFEMYRGRIGHHEVAAMKCGIGKVNAAIGTLTLADTFRPSLIINTGVAGGTGNGASVLDVVVATRVAYHDVWCGPGTVQGQASGYPRFFVSAIADDVIDRLGKVKRGLIASGDIFVSTPEEVKKILSIYPDAMAVDMESASIAQVCALKNIGFVCLRVISDTPGSVDDNISQYESFWDDAPARTFQTLSELVNAL